MLSGVVCSTKSCIKSWCDFCWVCVKMSNRIRYEFRYQAWYQARLKECKEERRHQWDVNSHANDGRPVKVNWCLCCGQQTNIKRKSLRWPDFSLIVFHRLFFWTMKATRFLNCGCVCACENHSRFVDNLKDKPKSWLKRPIVIRCKTGISQDFCVNLESKFFDGDMLKLKNTT